MVPRVVDRQWNGNADGIYQLSFLAAGAACFCIYLTLVDLWQCRWRMEMTYNHPASRAAGPAAPGTMVNMLES